MITVDQLCHIYGCAPERAAMYLDPLNEAMAEFGINTPARQAMFLAQVGHESARLVYVEEIATGSAYNGRADLGNTTADAFQWSRGDPGPYFKGHGLLQITGYTNHQLVGRALYPENPAIFLANPRGLCVPEDAARSACWFWAVLKDLNPVADAGDFASTTIAINGALNGEPDRVFLWGKAQTVLAATPAPAAAAPAAANPVPSTMTVEDVDAALNFEKGNTQ